MSVEPDVIESISFLGDVVVIDDSFAAVNIGIVLRNKSRYAEAEVIFRAILSVEPEYLFAIYELALVLAFQSNWRKAVQFARRAALIEPKTLVFQLLYAKLLAMNGDVLRALNVLDGFTLKDFDQAAQVTQCIQFIRYLAKFPYESCMARLEDAIVQDAFLGVATVERMVVDAIQDRTPFALVRQGDGEGAWTSMSNSEEAEFSDLYRANRRSLLLDWFGDDQLLQSDEFRSFALEQEAAASFADVLGLPDSRRIADEYSLLSHRGVPSCLNLLRKRGFFDDSTGIMTVTQRYCSANIHIDLLDAGFFKRLWTLSPRVGLITSFCRIADSLIVMGVDVVASHEIPGDSRNFWAAADGRPECQYPDHMRRVLSELSSRDLEGTVYLVAAGFVGKQYCGEIKRRGGVALDIGSVANRWGVGRALD